MNTWEKMKINDMNILEKIKIKDRNISEKIKINSEKKLEEWKTTPLKIAVTGQSGTGRKLKLCNIHILYHLYSHLYL